MFSSPVHVLLTLHLTQGEAVEGKSAASYRDVTAKKQPPIITQCEQLH